VLDAESGDPSPVPMAISGFLVTTGGTGVCSGRWMPVAMLRVRRFGYAPDVRGVSVAGNRKSKSV
jgi:hypothetical protein